MRISYVVSVGVYLATLAPLTAQTLPTIELISHPTRGEVTWSPASGIPQTIEGAVHGSVEKDGSSVVYTPTPHGEFWSVGSDSMLVTVSHLDGSTSEQRLMVMAGSPTLGPPTTHFEEGEPPIEPEDPQGQFSIVSDMALLGERSARITLNGSGEPSYLEYDMVEDLDLRGTNNSDAGCGDLRMGLGTPNLDHLRNAACLQWSGEYSICIISLMSAVADDGSEVFRLEAGISADDVLLRGVAFDTADGRWETPWVESDTLSHQLRLDWWTGTQGGLRLRVDGRVRAELNGISSLGMIARRVRVGLPHSAQGATFALNLDAISLRKQAVESDDDPLTLDPFEDDLSTWDAMGTAGGDVVITPAAALMGGSGLEVDLADSGWGAWILDQSPAGHHSTGLRFTLDTNTLRMLPDQTLNLVLGQPSNGPSVSSRFLIRLWQRSDNDLRIRASAKDDSGQQHHLPYAALSPGSHRVELSWRAATHEGSNDGWLRLWLDGQLVGELTRFDNDTASIESLRFGAMYLQHPGTEGILYLDEYQSWH